MLSSNTNNAWDNGPVRLQRNRSERKRLQGLNGVERTLINVSSNMAPHTQGTFKEKFNVWFVNEKGVRFSSVHDIPQSAIRRLWFLELRTQ